MKHKLASLLLSVPFFLALPACRSAARNAAGTAALAPEMEYAELCERPVYCLKISRLVLGTDHLGKMDNARTIEVLDEAVKLGINTFDTSPIYAEKIEARLGAWLQTRERTGLYTISKGGFPRDLGPGTYSSRLKGTKEEIASGVLEEINTSDRQLNHNITIYLLHRDDADFQDYARVERPQTPVRTILEAMASPEIRSKYRMLGVSNWDTPRVNESQAEAGRDPGLPRPVLSSPYFSLLEMSSTTTHSGGVQVKHADMLDPAFQGGIKIMTYSPLGGFSIIRNGCENARRGSLALKNSGDRYWGHAYDAIFHEANKKRFARALGFTVKFNAANGTHYTVDQVLNAYVLAHERVDFLAIGPRDVQQLRQTVEALRLSRKLTQADLDYLYNNENLETGDAVR
ncbi:MAG: aldo/keto reductase [Elusimicrobia bacterium]|nr:aldo/keto reductase [Elusimicrobiota bacterium]